MSESATPLTYDFCSKCGVPNALTARSCAGCGAELDRKNLSNGFAAVAAAPTPSPAFEAAAFTPMDTPPAPKETAAPAPAVEDPGISSMDALRQSLTTGVNGFAPASPVSEPVDDDNEAQGFDFCPSCRAPNALNRTECAGCGSSLMRESTPEPGPIVETKPVEEKSPMRYARDLRPPRPVTAFPIFSPMSSAQPAADPVPADPPPTSPNPVSTAAPQMESAPAPPAEAPAYDFCSCGVPNALTAAVCAGCGATLDRTGKAAAQPTSSGPLNVVPRMKPQVHDLSRRLIEQSANKLHTEPPQPQGGVVFCGKCGVPNAASERICVGCHQELNNAMPAAASAPSRMPEPGIAPASFGQMQMAPTPAAPAPSAGFVPVTPNMVSLRTSPSLPRPVAPAPPPMEDENIITIGELPPHRNPLLVLCLSILSLDLYRPYFIYHTTKAVDGFLLEKKGPSAGLAATTFFITFSLYDFYWDWMYAKKIARMMEMVNLAPVDNSMVFLFLNITVVGKLAIPAMMQMSLNEVRSAIESAYPEAVQAF